MDEKSLDVKRLEQQLFEELKPHEEIKKAISKRLYEQLIERRPVVKVQPIDVECRKLIESLRQRLLFLQEVFPPQKSNKLKDKTPKIELKNEYFELNLSSDSSDDEILANIIKNTSTPPSTITSKESENTHAIVKEIDVEESDNEKNKNKVFLKENENINGHIKDENKNERYKNRPTSVDEDIPLALRKGTRERKSSYKSYTSSSSSLKNGSTSSDTVSKKQHSKSCQKSLDSAVSTSGTIYHHDEDLFVEEDYETPHTFHIKIPSLFKRSVHNIHLDTSEFSRKVIEYRTKLSKQKCLQMKQLEEQQLACLTSSKKKRHNKKIEKLSALPFCPRQLEFFQQQQQDEELSQLIQDVMNDAVGNDETLQATTALENINNDINDNYRSLGTLMPISQSSHEQLSLSQNSTYKDDSTKKRRKTTRNSNDELSNDQPVKKRGRKPKAKTITAPLDNSSAQPPTKSNLAKYVECFANDCETLPNGSTTPAASSTMSQPLVTSTTQNFEFIDHQQREQQHPSQQQTQQQNITYFIDGDWANGGPCQLVQTTGMTIDAGQINQEAMNSPFQDFVNYIDNSADTGNNVISRVLDNGTSLPISIPLPIANMGYKNILQQRQLQQTTQNSLIQEQPVISIQIPSIPNNTGSLPPPPAHSHEEALDLSVKSNKSNFTIISSEVLNKNTNLTFETQLSINEEDNCSPLDLSLKTSSFDSNFTTSTPSFSQEKLPQQFSIGNNQDDDFIRRLIETNDFDLRPEELTKSCSTTTAAAYDNGESFKAALDMPILELNDADLVTLVQNTTTVGDSDELNKVKDNNISNDSTKFICNNNDSNYASMSESNTNVLTFVDEINFADQSTKEIFDKLLDIGSDNNTAILDTVGKDNNCSLVDLDESVFDRNKIQNSTMCEMENVSNQKDRQDYEEQNKINSSNVIKENVSTYIDNKTEVVNKFIPRILKRRKIVFQKYCPTKKSNVSVNKINEHEISAEIEASSKYIRVEAVEVKQIRDLKDSATKNNIESSQSPKENSKKVRQNKDNSIDDLESKTSRSNNQQDCISTKNVIIEINPIKAVEHNKTEAASNENEMVLENEASRKELNAIEIVKNEKTNKIKEEFKKSKESKEENGIAKSIVANETCKKEVHPNVDVENKKANKIIECEQKEKRKESKEEIETDDLPVKSQQYSQNAVPTSCLSEKPQDFTAVKDDEITSNSSINIINLKQSVSLTDKHDSAECVGDNNDSIESEESLNLKMSESDSCENSYKSDEINLSEKSINLKITDINPEEYVNGSIDLSANLNIPKNNTSDTSTNLNNSLSNKQDSTASLNLKSSENDTLQNSNKSTNNSPEKTIESDKSLNLKMSENDSLQNSSNSVKLNSPEKSIESGTSSKSNSPEQSIESSDVLFNLKSSKGLVDETAKIVGAEFSSNKNIVFSVAKIALSEDGAIFTDSDTSSRKSFDAPIHNQERAETEIGKNSDNNNKKSFDAKPTDREKHQREDTIMENVYKDTLEKTENVEDNEMDPGCNNLQIQHNEENLDVSMPKLTILENETNSFFEVEQNDKPLCLTKSIEKKYYLDFSHNDIIDFSVSVRSRDTDRDDLIIDESIQQSPIVVNSCYSRSIIEENSNDICCNAEPPNYIFPDNATDLEILDQHSQDIAHVMDCVTDEISENVTEEKNLISNSCSSKSNDLANLTPLELESQLEDILDFEDFDDALSLATSCFDSPNDDRFEETIVDGTGSQTAATAKNSTKSESEITDIALNSNLTSHTTSSAYSSPNGLRNFKIPKLNKISITSAAIADKPSDNITNFPGVPIMTINQPIVKIEKIARTVKNELATTGSVLVNIVQQRQLQQIKSSSLAKQQINLNSTHKFEIAASSATDPHNTRGVNAGLNGEALPLADKIVKVFGVTCQPYLVNECYAIIRCPLSHQINNPDTVFQALSSLSKVELNESYKFMYNHSNLFQIYFIVFCNYYASQKDRTKLLNMVNDCERYPEFSEFLIAIYEGLVKCGFSRVNACRQILKRSRERVTPIIDALVAIIMKSDWTLFTDFIDHITDDTYKYKFRIGVLDQMTPAVLNSKGPTLKQLFGKCVQMLHCEDTVLLCNSPGLIKCVALLTST